MRDVVNRDIIIRAFRYGVVGGSVNLALFLFYLGITDWGGITPLLATTIVYVIGVALTYAGNAVWSFGNNTKHNYAAPRYIATYLAGYLIQAGVLSGLVRLSSVPHPIAQLLAMASAAGSIFLLLNFWVFRVRSDKM